MLRLDRLVLIFSIVLLFGCASSVKFDPAMKSRFDDGIAINPSVKIQNKPFYHGPENTWGTALGGIVGGTIAAKAIDEPTKIKQYLEAEKIDVASLVLDEFKHQINKRPDFAGRIRDDGKYQLELEIPIYGLAQKHGFSSEYKPMLGLRAKIITPEGEVIWQNYNNVTNMNSKTLAFTYKDYFKSPEAFTAAYTSAAKIVVSLILDDLK